MYERQEKIERNTIGRRRKEGKKERKKKRKRER